MLHFSTSSDVVYDCFLGVGMLTLDTPKSACCRSNLRAHGLWRSRGWTTCMIAVAAMTEDLWAVRHTPSGNNLDLRRGRSGPECAAHRPAHFPLEFVQAGLVAPGAMLGIGPYERGARGARVVSGGASHEERVVEQACWRRPQIRYDPEALADETARVLR